MGVNRVLYGNTSVIDLTDSTVDADHLAEGYTAYDKSGEKITGTMTGGGCTIATATKTLTKGANSISFEILGAPKMFILSIDQTINSSSTRSVVSVYSDGDNTYGLYSLQSTRNSYGATHYSASYYSWTYANGVLTISSQSSSTGGVFRSDYQYRLTYVY